MRAQLSCRSSWQRNLVSPGLCELHLPVCWVDCLVHDTKLGAHMAVRRHAPFRRADGALGRHQRRTMSCRRSTKYKLDKVRGAVRKHCIKNFDTILAGKGAPCFRACTDSA